MNHTTAGADHRQNPRLWGPHRGERLPYGSFRPYLATQKPKTQTLRARPTTAIAADIFIDWHVGMTTQQFNVVLCASKASYLLAGCVCLKLVRKCHIAAKMSQIWDYFYCYLSVWILAVLSVLLQTGTRGQLCLYQYVLWLLMAVRLYQAMIKLTCFSTMMTSGMW